MCVRYTVRRRNPKELMWRNLKNLAERLYLFHRWPVNIGLPMKNSTSRHVKQFGEVLSLYTGSFMVFFNYFAEPEFIRYIIFWHPLSPFK